MESHQRVASYLQLDETRLNYISMFGIAAYHNTSVIAGLSQSSLFGQVH
jgi:hypothetical protein